jgi:lyso-ornithine lipid O-acyltransferase
LLSILFRLVKVFTLTAHYAHRLKKLDSEKNQEVQRFQVDQIKMEWAKSSLQNLGVELKVIGEPISQEPMLFVGNHLSYVDIPLLLSCAPISFVAKEELSHWPIIGEACRAARIVFVKRDSVESRKVTIQKIADSCLHLKQSICIFPSGTTSVEESKPWRRGAFEIARAQGIKVQPFRINYHPREQVAFVGDDALVPHLWRLLRFKKIVAEIEFHPPVEVRDSDESCQYWQNWAREILKR